MEQNNETPCKPIHVNDYELNKSEILSALDSTANDLDSTSLLDLPSFENSKNDLDFS
jgi:hypothetical protein